MDQKIIIATRKAFQTIYKMVFNEELKNTQTLTNESVNREYGVLIGFNGKIKGVFILKTQKQSAVAMTVKMLKTKEIDPEDVSDAIGEVLNMALGKVKHFYAEGGENPFSITPPTVIKGDYILEVKGNTTRTLFHFENENKEEVFCIELYVETSS
jgi:CheY-specific phosphatase CheX